MRIQFNPRNIVDAPTTAANKGRNFVDASLGRVINLKRGARYEAANEDHKHNRVKQRTIGCVEWTIDENDALIFGAALGLGTARYWRRLSPHDEQ